MSNKDFTTLYKYLDAKGGLKMLQNSNLQFTHATMFNDPFDCDPALFDYSNAPVKPRNWPPSDFLKFKGKADMEKLRNSTWICCLSKDFDSLLMWAYYNNHQGVCIGLNLDAVINSCQRFFIGLIPPHPAEVKYKPIHPKTDYFGDLNKWDDLLTTKAEEWTHEKEVRLITKDPLWVYPEKNNSQILNDWKEIRHYPQISGDCFESIYLGAKISQYYSSRIINAARKLNSNIKIFKMRTNPEAFKLKEELITEKR